ncbi:aldose 1-epimerase family protein [Marinilongibacter aquaticus]|uniref:aldose 1-epimerase family protein n=1 Tax=Marinilongibacter aquaticus TaxID=2975157 RepID=UPI0021BD7FF7|nr:aldose 1-epimerase family protein [Marinilongibacter aquaticus]UBM60551.1 aldose 1-epimerase family protein [Marinilongibacter aquaticus]
MVCLENDFLKVWIKPKGAELKSLVNKKNGVDHLWNADPYFWGKASPVLFPIVGALKNDEYVFEGESYSLPRHGFARDMMFSVESKSNEKAVFLLSANAETKTKYPFDFELRLIYTVQGNELKLTYEVQNTDSKTMYFSLGGHPAFAVPFEGAGTYPDYSIVFNKAENLSRFLLNKEGLLTGESEEMTLDEGKLHLSKELFYDDALVFKGLQSNVLKIVGKESSPSMKFKFEGFPFFGIWAAKNAPFVCLEPWCGVADNVQHNQELTEKEGIEKLTAGDLFSRAWSVEVN